MFDFKKTKTRRVFASVIVIILAVTMVVTFVFSAMV